MTSTDQMQSAASPSPWRAALPSRAALVAQGKHLRASLARSSHARWAPPDDRPDPLQWLVASHEERVPELIPIRYGRMLQSPFTFFRGSAAIMAADLVHTPTIGVRVQACGDCHLLNFGGFATPERRLLFDLNDFDETLPAPWEWDVKRLAASFVIASRHNHFSEANCRDAAQSCVRSYRERMAEFARWPMLDVWYASIDSNMVMAQFTEAQVRKRLLKRAAKAATRDVVEEDFPKLVNITDGTPIIRDNQPLIYSRTHKV